MAGPDSFDPQKKAKIAASAISFEMHQRNPHLWLYLWLDGCRKAYGPNSLSG